jgi:hypothetical protein
MTDRTWGYTPGQRRDALESVTDLAAALAKIQELSTDAWARKMAKLAAEGK